MIRIKELREERNFTQQQIAQAIGGTQSNIAKWEKGIVQPTADAIIKLSIFFNVSADYLLGQTDELGGTILSHANPSPLSAEEQKLLNGYRSLSKSTQEMLLRVLDNAVKAESRA